MISISGLSKQYGDRTLFADASLQLNAGERYGLVGANGSGKTTFLNILSGHDEPSAGSVSIPGRLRLGVLRQDQFLYEHEPILNVAMMGNLELWGALQEHEQLLANAHEHFDADRYSRVEETNVRHDGYSAEARADSAWLSACRLDSTACSAEKAAVRKVLVMRVMFGSAASASCSVSSRTRFGIL